MSRFGRWRDTGGIAEWMGCGIDTVFPPSCPFCNACTQQPELCNVCQDSLLTTATNLCPRCAAPVSKHFSPSCDECSQCRGESWSFQQVIALGPYQGALRDAVIRAKHAVDHPLSYQLGRHLGLRTKLLLDGACPERLIPVPMYWYRRFRRGINSASVLAEGASSVLACPVESAMLWCCRATRKQSMLSVHERHRNVRDAFRFWRRQSLVGQHVAIVDDTMTTGATAHELARLMRSAGAERVTVLIAARAISEWKHTGHLRKLRTSK